MAAITPKYSIVNTQFTTSSTSYQWTGDLGTPCIIGSGDLPAGGDFLVIYTANFGCSSNAGTPEIGLVYGRGAVDIGYSRAEGLDHGTPEAMRTGMCSGFGRLSTDGTKDIEFFYRATNATRPIYVKGASIVAVQLNESGAELTENTDFWHSVQGADVETVSSYSDVVTLTAVVSEPGDYILLASCGAYSFTSPAGDIRYVKVTVDGTDHKKPWVRQVKDVLDTNTFALFSKVTLGAGTHTIKIQGGGAGGGTKRFVNGNLWLFRKAKFRTVRANTGGTGVTIYTDYSTSFTDLLTDTYTPSGTEDVLVLGGGLFKRTNSGAVISHTFNSSTSTLLHDFCADINVSQVDQDQTTHLSPSVVSLSAARAFKYRAAGEDGYTTYPYCSVDYPELLLWGMTLAGTVTPDYEDTINEGNITVANDTADVPLATVAITETGVVLGPDYAYDPNDNNQVESVSEPTGISLSDSVSSALIGVVTVPADHPRIWLNPTRLSQLRTLAGYDDNGVQVSPPGSQFWQNLITSNAQASSAFAKALAYKISQNTAYRDAAIADIEAQITYDESAASATDNKRFGGQKDYLYYRDNMRDVALGLDWMWDDLSAAQRTRWMNWIDAAMLACWNDDREANALFKDDNWSITDPNNNHYCQKILGTVYGALATFYERRATFDWVGTFDPDLSPPWTGGTTFQNRWWMNNRDSNSVIYTDLWQFLLDKMGEQGFPVWDTYMDGGGWIEGANYGRGAHRSLLEAFLMMKQVAGVDYFTDPSHPCFKDMSRFYFYYGQPGYGVLNPDGDITGGEARAPIDYYNRVVMLFLAQALAGTPEGAYTRYWLENIQPTTLGLGTSWTYAFDFLLDDPTQTASNPFTDYPLGYEAPGAGYAFSRSAWANDAIAVTFQSMDMLEDHTHRNACAVNIYNGQGSNSYAGWATCETQPWGTAPTITHSLYHNTWTVNGLLQRYWGAGAPPVATLVASDNHDTAGANGYFWCKGDASDAYWSGMINDYSHGTTKVTQVAQRELFHIRPEYLVVFDRLTMMPGQTSATVQSHWHYQATTPTIASDIIKHDNGTNRLFQKILLPSGYSCTFADDFVETGKQDSWRATITAPSTPVEFLFVFNPTTTATSSMATTTLITSQGMKGCFVDDATDPFVCMFSSDASGGVPGAFSYSYADPTPACYNYLANLKPTTGYQISTSLDTGTRNVTVFEGGSFFTNANGILVFDPANLGAIPDLFQSITDSPVAVSSSIYALEDDSPITDANTVTLTDSLTATLIPAPSETDTINESDITVGAESVSVLPTETMTEGVTLSDTIVSTGIQSQSDTVTLSDSLTVTLKSAPPVATVSGSLIDKSVDMDTSIDKGPNW